MALRILLLIGLVVSPASTAYAVGAKSNIEEGLPVSIESPFTIEYLGREVQLATRYERDDEGVDSFRLEPRLELGVWWNTELQVSAPFLFGEVEPDGNRPIEIELTYNLTQETLDLPALSFAAGLELPTGEDANGFDPFFKVLLSRTIGKTWYYHQVHLNAEYQWNDDRQGDERSGRYMAAIGYSTLLNIDTLLIVDFLREQEMMENEEINLVEAGVRYQLTPKTVVSAGIGFGIGDESPDVRATLGMQYEF